MLELARLFFPFYSIALFILAIGWLDGGFTRYILPGGLLAERSVQVLTGAQCANNTKCLETSAPIAAYDEYRRCGGYIQSARSGESRLACSQTGITDLLLKASGEGRSFYREFRRSCRTHDLCYTHASATYSGSRPREASKDRCDHMLLADSVRDCLLLYPDRALGRDGGIGRRMCQWRAMAAYTAVSWLGKGQFTYEGGATCDFEPGPHAARDRTVAGRFVKGSPDSIATIIADASGTGLSVSFLALDDKGGAVALLPPVSLSPESVAIANPLETCDIITSAMGTSDGCPQTLADAGFHAMDWLVYPPIVADADGDGIDELILVSLTPRLGLVFTYVRNSRTAAAGGFLPIKAHVLDPQGLQKRGEFIATGDAPGSTLSDETATQMLDHQFVPVARPGSGCGELPAPVPQDIVLMGARAGAGTNENVYRAYRFKFDIPAQKWRMYRDTFNDDTHRMRYCERETVGQLDQPLRLQYPSFAIKGPVKCGVNSPKVIIGETVASIVREKCPSSVTHAKAGDLNDVDLMSYRLNTDYTSDIAAAKPGSDLKLVSTTWLPLIWNEVADPVMTSRAARARGVMMVGAYLGGTLKNSYPLISVLRNDQRLSEAAKLGSVERMPDTVGVPPAQYALLYSDNKAQSQFWRNDEHSEFGNPGTFFDLPAVLAPFDINGRPGLSVVMFANCATFMARNPGETCAKDLSSGRFASNTLQILIAPIPMIDPATGEAPGPTTTPTWLECAVPSQDTLAATPARTADAWSSDFLRNEPVLAGEFLSGERPGSLAITYRTAQGGIGIVALRNPKGAWRLGADKCTLLSPREKSVRSLYMMKLN